MKKNHMLRNIFLSSVLAMLAIMLMTPLASAHTSTSSERAVAASNQIAAVQNVNIVAKNNRDVFSQSTVQYQIEKSKLCVQITNLTNQVQVVENLGHTVVVLQPGQVGLISVTSGPGTYPLSLAMNSQKSSSNQ
jgi:methionine-rich copper-binding protein CopC